MISWNWHAKSKVVDWGGDLDSVERMLERMTMRKSSSPRGGLLDAFDGKKLMRNVFSFKQLYIVQELSSRKAM